MSVPGPHPPARGWAGARGLVAVAAVLLGVFAISVVLREPWRGHLARGDQWVTALALRWVRAWHRDGAWASRFALVESPPTEEFAGDRQVHKWGLPGEMLLLYALHEPFGREPDVESLNRVSLGLHLVLSLVLAVLAWLLARQAWPERPERAPLVALHCGAFVLLLPPILYWGQNITAQDFSVLPLLAFIVTARWLRASVGSRPARVALDLGVAMAVFLGTISEFLFWVIVPYLLVARLLAARRARPCTSDPWAWTLVLPFTLAVAFLAFVFVENGQLAIIRWRASSWTLGGTDRPGPGFLAVRVFLFLMFLRGHFSDAFGLLGVLSLVLAGWMLLPRGRASGLPPAARGILLDLLLPCLLFTLLLAHHQAFHSISAIKYVPFVALAWTFLTPWLIDRSRPRRKTVLAWAYGVVAFLAIMPFSSAYREFFPDPEPRWDREGAFLRENTSPADTVVSSATAIDLNPPQRIALAERRVTQVYGPLDLFHQSVRLADDTTIALYGPRTVHRVFGIDDAEVRERDGFCLARFPVRRFRALMNARPDATLRAHLGDVLRGDLATASGPRHRAAVAAPPEPPIAMHMTDGQRAALGAWDRLYWADEQHVHWRSSTGRGPARELVVLDGERFATDWMGLWRRVPVTDGAPLEWGRFVRGLFLQAEERARAGEAWASTWKGYDVVATPAGTAPAVLRARVPQVTEWTAYLLSKDGRPAGVALGPTAGAATGTNATWAVVLFDALTVDIAVPDDVSTDWTVKHPS